jgi:Ni/Co efflux regulator RcnB
MKRLLALALAVCAGAFLAAAPASSAPLGAAGNSVAATHEAGLVQQVHRRWRHHRRYYGYNPYYGPRYYGPRYYRPYYYGGYYPYYRRRPGFSIYLNF